MNSGIMPNLSRSSGCDLLEQLPLRALVLLVHVGAEADQLLADAVLDDVLEAGERAAADEQDVGRVDLQELLLRVLAAALGRHAARSCPR